MTVICNLTTIPSRFDKIQPVITNLYKTGLFDEVVVHIPKEYSRFGKFSYVPHFTECRVNLVDVDYGPATRIVYGEGDTVVWCDDDTEYKDSDVRFLLRQHKETGSMCGGSGFNLNKYFQGDFSKTPGMSVQVLEGYGMVVCSKEHVDKIREEVKSLSKLTFMDDMIVGNVTEKYNIPKLCFPWEIKQYEYGFGSDALHFNDGEKTHMHAYKRVLETFRKKNVMYFKPYVSYAIGVCNESLELDSLLYCLDKTMIHSDEVVVLIDTKKVTPHVYDVLEKYPWVRFCGRDFDGHFANHKNYLTSQCKGEYVFNIDADEVPSCGIVENIYKLIKADVIFIPRVNLLPGATQEFLNECQFSITQEGFINWPDYQGRIYKQTLRWEGDLHEKIQGFKTTGQLPAHAHASLWHVKSVQKMKAQADFYKSLKTSAP